jgi:hypothetical protein
MVSQAALAVVEWPGNVTAISIPQQLLVLSDHHCSLLAVYNRNDIACSTPTYTAPWF